MGQGARKVCGGKCAVVPIYFKDRQFVVLEQNYRNRYAEIDVIALKGDTVHFIEVKTRCSEMTGRASEAEIGRAHV